MNDPFQSSVPLHFNTSQYSVLPNVEEDWQALSQRETVVWDGLNLFFKPLYYFSRFSPGRTTSQQKLTTLPAKTCDELLKNFKALVWAAAYFFSFPFFYFKWDYCYTRLFKHYLVQSYKNQEKLKRKSTKRGAEVRHLLALVFKQF